MEMTRIAHIVRVRQELAQAGLTRHGLARAESRYLPGVIHMDEHIKAAIFGRVDGGAALLVATDRRVIFLDRKPLFTTCDELPYQSVAGIKHYAFGLFATIILHTRIGDYTLRYVDRTAASAFMQCIERERIESADLVSA